MKRLRTYLLVSGSLVSAHLAVSKPANPLDDFEIPAALMSTAPEIPEAKNQLSRFLAIHGKSTPEQTAKLRSAIDQLKSGKCIEDKELLGELARIREQAGDMLKPPMAFIQDGTPVAVGLFRVFQGADILARQALLKNERSKADQIIGDMLRWNQLLRHAQPNQVQWLLSRSGWKMAFDTLLEDLPKHPEKLAEIVRLMRENRVEPTELAECLKMEARFWKAPGGLKAMLDEPGADSFTIFLKPPFNDLSIDDLRALPYDAEADFRRCIHDMSGTLDCLKKNVPVNEWPGIQIAAGGRTLKDYRMRPNGLGDLFYEQESREIQVGFWNSALGNDSLLEASLLWLKNERNGEVVTLDLLKGFLDPVDGAPLSIDFKERTIRSRGMNGKVDPREPELGPLPAAGFTISGDDSVIVVPRWN